MIREEVRQPIIGSTVKQNQPKSVEERRTWIIEQIKKATAQEVFLLEAMLEGFFG